MNRVTDTPLIEPQPLAATYWLNTSPVLLAALGDQSGLKKEEVAELLVDVERELLNAQHDNVHDGMVVFAYLDLIAGVPHGKHSPLV